MEKNKSAKKHTNIQLSAACDDVRRSLNLFLEETQILSESNGAIVAALALTKELEEMNEAFDQFKEFNGEYMTYLMFLDYDGLIASARRFRDIFFQVYTMTRQMDPINEDIMSRMQTSIEILEFSKRNYGVNALGGKMLELLIKQSC